MGSCQSTKRAWHTPSAASLAKRCCGPSKSFSSISFFIYVLNRPAAFAFIFRNSASGPKRDFLQRLLACDVCGIYPLGPLCQHFIILFIQFFGFFKIWSKLNFIQVCSIHWCCSIKCNARACNCRQVVHF